MSDVSGSGLYSRGRRYRTPSAGREGIVVLSPVRKNPSAKSSGGNSAEISGPGGSPSGVSSQKRMLKMKLEGRRWTIAVRKDGQQMLHCLQQRLHLPAGRRGLLPAQPRSHPVQPALQAKPQPTERFQGKRQSQFFCSGFAGKSGQQLHQPPPRQRSSHGVTR